MKYVIAAPTPVVIPVVGTDAVFPGTPGVRNTAVGVRTATVAQRPTRPPLVTVAYVFPRPTDWA